MSVKLLSCSCTLEEETDRLADGFPSELLMVNEALLLSVRILPQVVDLISIIAVSLAIGLGLNLVPTAVQYLPGVVKVLATSAVAPTALVAVILNLVLPEED